MFRTAAQYCFGVMTAMIVGLVAAIQLGTFLNQSSSQIAFESDRDGNWEIYTLDARTGISVNLTHNASADHAPTWSADGRQIAFHSNRESDTDIYVMNADGRDARRLTFTGRDWRPRWSPDGQQLLYIHGFNEIYTMNRDGSGARYVTTGFGPEWSPDGQQIVYYVNPRNSLNSDIHLCDADGRNPRRLTSHAANDWGPSWLPDGQSVAFISLRDGQARVYVVDTVCMMTATSDEGCTHRLGLNSAISRTPRWSPDGRQVAFESVFQWQLQLYTMDADGTRLRRITPLAGNDQLPAWSP